MPTASFADIAAPDSGGTASLSDIQNAAPQTASLDDVAAVHPPQT